MSPHERSVVFQERTVALQRAFGSESRVSLSPTPPGHYMRITGRSSTPVNHGVMVIEGVIDEDYCGDDDVLKLQVWNFTDTPSRVPLQARIAQGIFIPVTKGQFVETNQMGESRGGFGSTG